ncbi:MAG: response regulator [Desulfobacterales bacterium]|nr:response regulator [Desulfobacterales bacterium]
MRENVPILLVEDDDVDAENVVRAFKKNKITNPLYMTPNGEEALALLRREGRYNDSQKYPSPGIVLLDINMPRMNGIEFLKIIKADEAFKHIPVVVLTTSREENDRVESFKLSVAGYIIKPVDFEHFIQVIQTINLYWTLSELG